jgi:hypothetical protein
MHAIRKKYTYNHVHDAMSLQTILTELAGADGVRALLDAPAPNAGTAHSVANSVSFLNSMMNINSKSDYTVLEEEVPTELKVLLTLTGTLMSLLKHTTEDPAPGCLSRRRIVKMIYFML